MNGPDLADEALTVRPGLKLLFSSGYADSALVHHGRLDPGVNLLGKPYGRRELARKVREVLNQAAAEAPAPSLPGRLLILDDHAMVAQILAMAAQRLGLEVVMTSKPSEFLARARSWQPSHVAIDLAMPDMSGVEVLNRLAEAGSRARVIISSGADAGQIQAAMAHARAGGLQVAGALAKPFSLESLRAVLDR